jgi:transposase-like protein
VNYGMKLPVHGHMMTVADVARIFGVSRTSVYKFRNRHRDADGRPMPLEAVYDRYAAVRRGDIPRVPGRKPARHRCAGRLRTVKQAAEALGVTEQCLYALRFYHKCTLDEAWRRVERARMRRAERQILDIILRGK